MPVAGVGSCVRGEVTRFPLSRGVCRVFVSSQTTVRVKTFYLSAHTCVNRRAHTQPPDIISSQANSRQRDNVGKWGGHHYFPGACF